MVYLAVAYDLKVAYGGAAYRRDSKREASIGQPTKLAWINVQTVPRSSRDRRRPSRM